MASACHGGVILGLSRSQRVCKRRHVLGTVVNPVSGNMIMSYV